MKGRTNSTRRRSARHTILSCMLAGLCATVATQSVSQAALDCVGYQVSALAIPEPWDDFTRIFANGAIRVTLMDTIEPGVGPLYLMVQTPPRDEMGNRSCAVIAATSDGLGFGDMMWPALDASYDPARGLIVEVPVKIYHAESSAFVQDRLFVTINQSTGAIVPSYLKP